MSNPPTDPLLARLRAEVDASHSRWEEWPCGDNHSALIDEAADEIERLTAALAEASTSQLVQERIAQANLRLFAESQAELARLRANQAEAVRILSAIEFDGQAYAAIQRACKLLAGAAELNAALNIGQETGHAKRTADETDAIRRGVSNWVIRESVSGETFDPHAFCAFCGFFGGVHNRTCPRYDSK